MKWFLSSRAKSESDVPFRRGAPTLPIYQTLSLLHYRGLHSSTIIHRHNLSKPFRSDSIHISVCFADDQSHRGTTPARADFLKSSTDCASSSLCILSPITLSSSAAILGRPTVGEIEQVKSRASASSQRSTCRTLRWLVVLQFLHKLARVRPARDHQLMQMCRVPSTRRSSTPLASRPSLTSKNMVFRTMCCWRCKR